MHNNHKHIYGNSLWYATKVWLTGILIPAVFWALAGGFLFLGLAIFYSAAFSIPSWLLLWVGVVFINKRTWEVGMKKALLCILSFMLTAGAFSLLNVTLGEGGDLFGNFQLALIFGYAASTCLGIVFFDLEGFSPVNSNELVSQILESQHDPTN